MTAAIFRSPAKINLGLAVLSQRSDEYHNLHTLFQELSFHDTLRITAVDAGCHLTASVDWLPLDESNLAFRAWRLLKDYYPDLGGVDIHIEKRIPAGAGLGGGSGNGATVLKAINKLYRLNLTPEDLEKLAVQLGADVPFFIRGGLQLGEGIGERLTPIDKQLKVYIVLVIPPVSISTAWAYGELKNTLTDSRRQPNFAGVFQEEKFAFTVFENDFERIVIPAYPEIGRIKQQLVNTGAVFASLSGSGSTVYGLFDEEASALEAESALRPFGRTILTQPAPSTPDL
ncbi:MAG: 4-(cytidine 5'-diphospho)-2-C-methyl-D-erythritol kinase [FCB group bacterium]|nr:4-(cytidine 5'-diphospho)-2-C-methyl-D-erythritol kinase [FCB group bacterium]